MKNAAGHPAQLEDFYPDVKVVYFPLNTTVLLQPMDQGVIASFKAYYLRRTIAMALQATTLYISCLYCCRTSAVYLSCLYYSSFSTILLIQGCKNAVARSHRATKKLPRATVNCSDILVSTSEFII